MIFWTLSLLMLAGAIMCILLPLARQMHGDGEQVDAIDVYKQQLAELESTKGKNSEETALIEQERDEISRRILRQARRNNRKPIAGKLTGSSNLKASLIALILLPVIALPTYLSTGSPQLPDKPLKAQETVALEGRSINEMVQIAERHLAQNPKDVKGWTVLAGAYGRINRPDDKAHALQQIIQLSGETPVLLTDLAEALTVANGNIVPENARKLFDKALSQNPDLNKARFYLATALQQEGRDEEALKAWEELSLTRKNDTRWQQITGARIAEIREKLGKPALPGPTRADIENASQMSGTDRQAMIETMVANLAEKLRDDPSDIEGWSRLIRSYSVLKKPDKAKDALLTARSTFKDQKDSLQKLDVLASTLGIPKNKPEGEIK